MVSLLAASAACGDDSKDKDRADAGPDDCVGDECEDGDDPQDGDPADGDGNGDGNGDGQGDGQADGEDPIQVDGEWEISTGTLAGLDSICGTLIHVSPRPDDDTLIAGVVNQGLWSSSDGDNWTQMATFAEVDNGTAAILYDPEDPDTFWQAGTYGTCAYVTHDNGGTFDKLGDATHCDSISVDFTDPERQTIIAGGHERHIVYRSTDGGETWTDIGPNIPADAGYTGFVLTLGPDVHLVATWASGNGTAGVFRSTDGGDSFERVYTGAINSRPLIAQDGTIYWVLRHHEGMAGIIKSTDDGATWEKIAGSESVVTTEVGLMELPDGRLVAPTQSNLVISSNGGESWALLGPAFPFTPWGVTYSAFRKEFYAWYFTCNSGANPVQDDALVKLGFDYEAQ